MNKEEKAIEELKEEINKPVELPENRFDTFILFNIKSAKTVLNYIDKLQKANKYLKERLEFRVNYCNELEHELYEEGNYIHKEAIRKKIKELEEEMKKISEVNWKEEQIEVLEEILGE